MHLSLLFFVCLASLNVTVTFSSLGEDVKLILSENDNLFYIAPPGVDPHLYQLTPEDIKKLKNSDLIISTAHAPFEMKIRELVSKGEIKAKLIEIPFINGIKLRKNPELNQDIYHMPVYDPNNYEIFIKYLSEELAKLNPNNETEYKNKAEKIIEKVEQLKMKTPKLNLSGVGDFPYIPYAVSWIGINVTHLIVKEWGIPPTPGDLMKIENDIKSGKIKIAVVTTGGSAISNSLERIAAKYNLPILYVESPVAMKSILDKLENISINSKNLIYAKSKSQDFDFSAVLVAVLIAIVIKRVLR